jgi:predicted ATP-grasp superfamily ATP-dependent carboligase
MPSQFSSSDEGVVVPAIKAASSLACLRSLSKRGIRTIGISEDRTAPALHSKHCDETSIVPDPTDDLEAYERELLALARREDVRTIIPVRESDIYVLARNRDAFSGAIGTPWSDLETLRNVQDRVRLFEAAEAADVSMPETKVFDEWDDWGRESIIKPRYTLHATEYDESFAESHTQSHSTQYVPSDTEPDRDELVAKMGHVPLVQEYVPDSDEYAFFALYEDGEAKATFQHRQRRGYNYCGGPSAYRESVDVPELDAAGRRLLDHLDWHGLAMVEFLRDPETGEFELMEINPRFWTSLPFTVQAGVDLPHYYWLQATGRSGQIDASYERGVAGHLLRGELCHLHSILFDDYPLVERPSFVRTAGEVLSSMVRHPRFDYLDPNDPKPFVRDVRNTFDSLFRGSDESESKSVPESRPNSESASGTAASATHRQVDRRTPRSAEASAPVAEEYERESGKKAMVDGGKKPDADESGGYL